MHRPKVGRIAENQRRRKQTFAQQGLARIDVADDAFEQSGPLAQGRFDLRPVLLFDNEGQQIERPAPGPALRVGIDVVRDAVFLDTLLEPRFEFGQVGQPVGAQRAEEFPPAGAQFSVRLDQFIEMPRRYALRHGASGLDGIFDFRKRKGKLAHADSRLHRISARQTATAPGSTTGRARQASPARNPEFHRDIVRFGAGA